MYVPMNIIRNITIYFSNKFINEGLDGVKYITNNKKKVQNREKMTYKNIQTKNRIENKSVLNCKIQIIMGKLRKKNNHHDNLHQDKCK